ncbi:MAG: lipopolysaccharide heptosyltransferase II [Bryobacteraceae bacterium]
MPASIEFSRIVVRATNWLGDAVMSLPALRSISEQFPGVHIAVQAMPWVADLYAREKFPSEIILYNARRGASDWKGKWRAARRLRAGRFDCAILLTNSFDSALICRLAGIPRRIGYDRDGRGLLLTDRVRPPAPGETPRHERYYYLELLRRAGIIEALPEINEIRLDAAGEARVAGEQRCAEAGLSGPVIGVSPGAAYGGAKRWLPERFAEAAALVAAAVDGSVAVFGSKDERPVAELVMEGLRARGCAARNFAGETTLREYIDLAAACRLFLTNDSGAMHVAAALDVPTVAVFGSTDDVGTGPVSSRARVVREPVDCSPCLLRECPIDHRCMTRVPAERVAAEALELLK